MILPSLFRDFPPHFLSLSFFEFNDVVGLFCGNNLLGDVKQLLFSDISFWSIEPVVFFGAIGGDVDTLEFNVELVAAHPAEPGVAVDPIPRRIEADENVWFNCWACDFDANLIRERSFHFGV